MYWVSGVRHAVLGKSQRDDSLVDERQHPTFPRAKARVLYEAGKKVSGKRYEVWEKGACGPLRAEGEGLMVQPAGKKGQSAERRAGKKVSGKRYEVWVKGVWVGINFYIDSIPG